MLALGMPRPAPPITLGHADRQALASTARAATSAQRDVLRARIVLLAADGVASADIAPRLGPRPATVSKWRGRSARLGMPGLLDEPRPGKAPVYTPEHERRVLALLDRDPPKGFARWNGRLLARELGDVSDHQVW